MDVKVTSVSRIVDETQSLIVDGVKGMSIPSLIISNDMLTMICDRKGSEKYHGLAEPYQSSRNPCYCFKKARAGDWSMVSGGRGLRELETRPGDFALACGRWYDQIYPSSRTLQLTLTKWDAVKPFFSHPLLIPLKTQTFWTPREDSPHISTAFTGKGLSTTLPRS